MQKDFDDWQLKYQATQCLFAGSERSHHISPIAKCDWVCTHQLCAWNWPWKKREQGPVKHFLDGWTGLKIATRSASPKPHPSKPHPCNMPQAKTEVALQFSECCAADLFFFFFFCWFFFVFLSKDKGKWPRFTAKMGNSTPTPSAPRPRAKLLPLRSGVKSSPLGAAPWSTSQEGVGKSWEIGRARQSPDLLVLGIFR